MDYFRWRDKELVTLFMMLCVTDNRYWQKILTEHMEDKTRFLIEDDCDVWCLVRR